MNINLPAVVILLAGLVGNMWAVAGDTLPNGSGTLDFSFIARPASEGCPISVEKSNQSAVIKTSDVPANSDKNKVVVRLSNAFTIQQCRGALIGLSVDYSVNDYNDPEIVRGRICHQGGQGGGCSFGSGLSYFVVVPSNIVLYPTRPSYPVQWNGSSVIPAGQDINHVMTIAPDSDNWTFSADTIVMPMDDQALTAGTMTGSYTLVLSFD
ncbi:hypothetical protein AADY61_004220 [Salmonella enterica]